MKSSYVTCLLALAIAAGGCALTSKSDPLAVRYFTPETTPARLTSSESPRVANAPPLRLGRVTSGRHLREEMVYRDSHWEVGFYDDRRWTERPEVYVRHALSTELFEAHGMRHVVGGTAPTLDVEVLAFDELKMPTNHAARVQLRFAVHDDRTVLVEDTVTVDRPIAGAKADAVVAAMAEALAAAADVVAKRVGTALAPRAE